MSNNQPTTYTGKISLTLNTKITMENTELELLISTEIDALANGLRHPLTVKHNLINRIKELEAIKLNLPVVSRSLPILVPNFIEAAKLAFDEGTIGMGLLTRRFNITYNEAIILMDELEEKKVVSAFSGVKNRDVLISKQDLDNLVVNYS